MKNNVPLDEIAKLRLRNAELEAKCHRLQQMSAYIGELVWEADITGAMTRESSSWRSSSGMDTNDVLGFGWLEAIYPDDRERVLTAWREAVWTKKPYNIEYRLREANGKYKWSHAFAAPVFDQQGELISWAGINIDIHDRKQTEGFLHDIGETTFAVADQLFDGVHMMDVSTLETIYINKPLVGLTGFSMDELWKFPLTQITERLHPEDRAQTIKIYQQLFDRTIGEQDLNLRWQVKSGEYRWFNVRHKIIFDSQGKLNTILQIISDITGFKESERRQKLINQLRQTDENRSLFLSIMSHELRNPLASIMMGIEIQKRSEPGSAEDRNAREIIERQGEQLSRLVDDLLDVSRISQKSALVEKDSVELNKLIREAAADFGPLFEEKGVALRVLLPEEPIYLKADASRLVQSISNILHNAWKFSEAYDEAQIAVEKDVRAQEVVITVKDTGSGILPDLLPHLFQPFMQADHSLARSSGGLGLGLAITKQMVELHDGSINIVSPGAGKGTLVTIRLPLALADVAVADADLADDVPGGSALRILVIDDIPDITSIVSSLLELMGHKAFVANSGLMGIAKARRERPDVILCDIGLPGMSGYEVAQCIRQDRDLQGIRLIALSGYAQEKDREQSRAAGFDQHLAKPVSLASLQTALKQ